MKAKYVNPFTDFGFKKIFGEEASKPLLLDFLNSLLPPLAHIRDLSFKNPEKPGLTETDRKSIFDIYCEGDSGEKFIVELQKAKQDYFIDRTIYYSTFPIIEQAQKGNWNYFLNAVYCVGILDFTFRDYEDDLEQKEVVHTVHLKNHHGEIFYDKLAYIYLEMLNFTKQEHELVTQLDKWLYFIKHLEDFESIPDVFRGIVVFETAFEKAELAKFNAGQMIAYERSLREFRDAKNTFNYAIKQAQEASFNEGGIKRENEIAAKMKARGIPTKDISDMTRLTEEEIDKL